MEGALKVIPKMLGADPTSDSKAPEYSTRLLRERAYLTQGDKTAAVSTSSLDETKALKKVADFRGTLNLLASFHDTRNFYNFTNFCPGGDLSSLIKRCGPMSSQDVQFYVADLLQSIKKIHDTHMVHRDIKPGNILVDKDGHLVLADFGLARIFNGSNTAPSKTIVTSVNGQLITETKGKDITCSVSGTPGFIPPETILGNGASYGADIFALGVLVFIMLTGRDPWTCFLKQHQFDVMEVVVNRHPSLEDAEMEEFGISKTLCDFVFAALEKDPKLRPSTQQLMDHPFFDDFDWNQHESRLTRAPWVPPMVNLDTVESQSKASRASTPPPIIRGGEQFDGSSLMDRFPEYTYLSPTSNDALETPPPTPSVASTTTSTSSRSPLSVTSSLVDPSPFPSPPLSPPTSPSSPSSSPYPSPSPSSSPSDSIPPRRGFSCSRPRIQSLIKKVQEVPTSSPVTPFEDTRSPTLSRSSSISRMSKIKVWAIDVWTKLKHRRTQCTARLSG
ncbi:hypothetical protein ABKN59_002665 [Abortiporus biennis]